jgi:hypothetical protein
MFTSEKKTLAGKVGRDSEQGTFHFHRPDQQPDNESLLLMNALLE